MRYTPETPDGCIQAQLFNDEALAASAAFKYRVQSHSSMDDSASVFDVTKDLVDYVTDRDKKCLVIIARKYTVLTETLREYADVTEHQVDDILDTASPDDRIELAARRYKLGSFAFYITDAIETIHDSLSH